MEMKKWKLPQKLCQKEQVNPHASKSQIIHQDAWEVPRNCPRWNKNISRKSFMTKLEDHDNWLLMQKLCNSDWTNLSEWVEKIVDKFYKEK